MLSKSIVLAVAVCVIASAAYAAKCKEIRLPFQENGKNNWTWHSKGEYEGWVDHRGLFVLRHPWTASQVDSFGMVTREVKIPSQWDGRARLHFYMSDDYFGNLPNITEGWLGQIKLVGHRFKQVLIDGKMIWETDVADLNSTSDPSHFSVLLPESVKPGDQVEIAFRVIDKVATSERLPDDHRYIGTTDGITADDEWKFMTNLFVGDVSLTDQSVESLAGADSPTAQAVRTMHKTNKHPKKSKARVRFPVSLSVESTEKLTTREWPVHCGVPFPLGKLHDAAQIVLSDHSGKRLPVQARAMNTWPDGSLRWVEIDAIVPSEILSLDIRSSKTPLPVSPVSVSVQNENEFLMKSGALEIQLGGEDERLVNGIRNGTSALHGLRGEIECDGKVYRQIIEKSRILAEGPIRAEVELTGLLKSDSQPMGRFVFRISVFAGQPFVRMTWRVFNDRSETLKISRFELIAQTAQTSESEFSWNSNGKKTGNGASVNQLAENQCEVRDEAGAVIESGTSLPGWLAAKEDRQTLLVLTRHFKEQFPKSLEMKRGHLRISLFEANKDQPYYEPTEGEAKLHEVWLGLWDKAVEDSELEAISQYFARPARLFDADYFCATGGMGDAAPHSETLCPAFDIVAKERFKDAIPAQFYVNGIRNWGDKRYGALEADNWCNGYYDAQQGFASEYLMSGQPKWFDYLQATVRHLIDIDVCHSSSWHPDWVGAIHCGHTGPNHATGAPWNPGQRIRGTLAYWRFSADPDAREDALGVADSAAREGSAIGVGSVRDHAGILYALTSAYDETYDPKYLEAAKVIAHDAMKRIDARRGSYLEVHGNVSYQGNVPWMCAQLAEPMYYYYRQSGDVDAAIAVVQLAESILTENCTRGVLGDVYGYSHNPHFKKTTNYHVLIAATVFYAYELTGDRFYLDHALAMYDLMLKEKDINDIRNCYWLAPTLLYYMQHLGEGRE